MKITTTRINHLNQIIKRYEVDLEMSQKIEAFSKTVGISTRKLSHYICHRREIGEATARQIELKLGLEVGFLDAA